MRCPFLREAQVKFCQASPFKKMIVRTPGQAENEKCSSPDYVSCPAAKQSHEEFPSQTHCPFLTESLVQYCSAASVTKFIPYSESVLSRCGTENHRYCELYMALAHTDPHKPPVNSNNRQQENQEQWIDGIQIPNNLSFSANHLWLDAGEDGCYHVGIDGFLASVLGEVEAVNFVTLRGLNRPTVVLTARGVDLQMMFLNPMLITRTNSYLRTRPDKAVTEPYGIGWLFEGAELKPETKKSEATASNGMIHGKAVRDWMRRELNRMSEFVHEEFSRIDLHGQPLLADGGAFTGGLVRHLNRDEILHLFNEFFSPYASWRR